MIYLIILLTITHIIVLYQLKKYLDAYKKNNHNYITGELHKMNQSFCQSVDKINKSVTIFSQNTAYTFKSLEDTTTTFTKNYRKSFLDLTSFIKSDYKSLTGLMQTNNDLLENLLYRTEESIIKNKELKPLLINSHEELEKIYGKIKLLISGYEKGLKSIQNEMEDTIITIENKIDTKIKHIATKGEKTISESLALSKSTIRTVTEETNTTLKTILRDNQMQVLTSKIQTIEEELNNRLLEVNITIKDLETIVLNTLKILKETNQKGKKGFLGFYY